METMRTKKRFLLNFRLAIIFLLILYFGPFFQFCPFLTIFDKLIIKIVRKIFGFKINLSGRLEQGRRSCQIQREHMKWTKTSVVCSHAIPTLSYVPLLLEYRNRVDQEHLHFSFLSIPTMRPVDALGGRSDHNKTSVSLFILPFISPSLL